MEHRPVGPNGRRHVDLGAAVGVAHRLQAGGDHALTRAFYLLQDFPGEAEVVLEMQTTAGARRLRLGPSYRVTPSPSLRASLDQLLGDAALAA